LPPDAPLTYVLAFKACISDDAPDRPSFADVVTLLDDICAEVDSGIYINAQGVKTVRHF
jgi:hypothetical protein